MITLVENIKEANCITHSGTMHADEVFATAFLELYLKEIKVTRVSEITNEDQREDVIIYDIGGGKFDHHQENSKKRENGIAYSSFGLLWKYYGKAYLKQQKIKKIDDVFTQIDKDFVEGIDAMDNGIFPKVEAPFKMKTIDDIIHLFNPTFISTKQENTQFLKAVQVAKTIFQEEVDHALGKVIAKTKVIEAIKKAENHILVLDQYMPYEETLLKTDLEQKIYFVIFPSNRGGYAIKAVPKSNEDRTNRMNFPKEWGGLRLEELERVSNIPGFRFCHKGLFFATCNNKETALYIVNQTIEQQRSLAK